MSSRPASSATPTVPVRVWDLPTRLFHWLLVLGVVGLYVTANIGGNAMDWHFRLGLGVGALLVFRVLWGLVGGRWSRFASFVRSPGTVLRYLRGEPVEGAEVGHNPLGAFSVLGLLGLLLLQVATGLVADDEISNVGPLNRFVSSALAGRATSWHADIGQLILMALVALHVGAIFWYLHRKRINLVRPMLSGDKALPPGTPASTDNLWTRLLALLLLAACVAGAGWVFALGNAAPV